MAVRPVMIVDEVQLVGILRGRREALGVSQGELDDRVGWADGYSAKLEAPDRKYGRRVAWGISAFLNWWLEALGLTLVLMDKEQAQALIAAADGTDLASSTHRAYPGRERCRPPVVRRTLATRISFLGPV